MGRLLCAALVLTVFVLSASFVTAQERVPHKGSVAAGIDIGTFVPADDAFDPALLVNGLYEYYVTPRVSLRTEVGWANPGLSRTPVELRQIPLRFDVNYNWEGGKWHPFVGTGLGAYFLQAKSNNEPFGTSETKAGFNVGGGIEYFVHRAVTFKGEARYQRIASSQFVQNPSGIALTAGLKTYF
jgi:Outer membrane protein beta-barrel domain